MSLLKHLLLAQGMGTGKPIVIYPMEYVCAEGTASPYDVMYDTIHIAPETPVSVAQSEDAVVTGVSHQRKLVRMSDGTLYAVYFKQLAGNYQIYVKRSVNEGATWTDETLISTYGGMDSYNQASPSIAVDSSDYLHVIWSGKANGFTTNNQIWYTKYTDSWSAPIRISTYAGMQDERQSTPSIAVDSSDYLHVVWGGRATGHTIADQIWYTKYTTSWFAPLRISTLLIMVNKSQGRPSIAVDSSNYLHVVWHGITSAISLYQIWYTKYAPWSDPIRISTYAGMNNYPQIYPSIAVDSSDYLHVVWGGRATGHTVDQIWYTKYTDSWSAPIRISTYAGMQDYAQEAPSIAVDSDDYLHVIWHGKASGYTTQNVVWYAEYTDAWATPEVLQPTGRNQYPNLRWSRWP